MIAASVIAFSALNTLTITYKGVKISYLEAEVIAIGVLCFLGEFFKVASIPRAYGSSEFSQVSLFSVSIPYIVIAATMRGSANGRSVNV